MQGKLPAGSKPAGGFPQLKNGQTVQPTNGHKEVKEMERTKAVKLMGAALPAILLLFPIAGSTTPPIVVTTTDDVVDAAIDCESVTIADLPGPDGVKSLREAICAAENNPGIDEIHFDIPGPGPHVIRIEPSLGQLPMIEEEIIIDGTTEPDFVAPGPPVVVLDGTNITLSANGLAIQPRGWYLDRIQQFV